MQPPKPVMIQQRVFLSGTMECPCCEALFEYCLPREVYLFWEGFCWSCTSAPIFEDADGDGIHITELG